MNQEKIGQFIKEIRKDNKLTQEEFAVALGVTYQAVSKWETGKSLPDISILKLISEIYGVNIDDLLKGERKTNSRRTVVLIFSAALVIVGIIVSIFIYSKYHHDFEFKIIGTTCSDFTLNGSAAYNRDKTSIHISNVVYCGKENNIVYEEIECNLYEKYNQTTTLISSCSEKMKNIKLEDFLKKVEIKVDNYSSTCKKFQDSFLYLEIKSNDSAGTTTTYEIPLTLEDNC